MRSGISAPEAQPESSTSASRKGDPSVKLIRKRLTYANVMSSIAVFLVLGGATAFAASKIGTSKIKANAITTGKIKKEAVTTAKIKKDAVTGAKVKESTLEQVPSALNATNAGNANTVGGMHVGRINFIAQANTPNTTVFSANGLTLNASCDAGSELNLTATTSVNHAEIFESGNFASTFAGGLDFDFNVGETENVGEEIGDNSQEEVQGQLVYSTPTGAVVTAQFSLEDNGLFGGQAKCAVEGTTNFS
jgi:hypothetical protein